MIYQLHLARLEGEEEGGLVFRFRENMNVFMNAFGHGTLVGVGYRSGSSKGTCTVLRS